MEEGAGTCVVHQAPAFGEDDYRVCTTGNAFPWLSSIINGLLTIYIYFNILLFVAGIIQKGGKLVCPVDDNGEFTEEVKDFAGQHVKKADK